MKHDYLVWDEINSSREHASKITCEPYAYEAAQAYAAADSDGLTDGIYQSGHPVIVEDSNGVRRRFEVRVEWEPVFHAREMANEETQ